MRTLHIHPLTDADMPAVMHIQACCYTAIEPESAASMAAKRSASPATCLGVRLQGADQPLLGYLLALPLRWPQLPALNSLAAHTPPDADTLYLHDLALLPQARGSGAGNALVCHALTLAHTLHLPAAALIAIQHSAPYWHRHGFTAIDPPDAATRAKLHSYGPQACLMWRRV
ncbi:MAG: GNAT family N-acetyltransferase [Pseudomonadota bacterium]|nr:GNAT family N-acetyltransferase [Pseudomonadota bacterium]